MSVFRQLAVPVASFVILCGCSSKVAVHNEEHRDSDVLKTEKTLRAGVEESINGIISATQYNAALFIAETVESSPWQKVFLAFEREAHVRIKFVGEGNDTKFEGSYRVDDNGRILLDLSELDGEWPLMEYEINSNGQVHLKYQERGSSEISNMANECVWPFRFVGYSSKPAKLLSYARPEFSCEVDLPKELVQFELIVEVLPDGGVVVERYIARGISTSEPKENKHSFNKNDWRSQVVDVATDAVRKWKFEPHMFEGKPQSETMHLDFIFDNRSNTVSWDIRESSMWGTGGLIHTDSLQDTNATNYETGD